MNRWIILALGLALISLGCGKKGDAGAPMTESADLTVSEEPEKTEATREVGDKVNINTADKAALASVPAIGDKMAEDIISHREANGKFKNIDELKGAIHGIGDKKFEKMKNYITVEGGISHGEVAVAESKPEGGGRGKSMKKAPAGKININTASSDQLTQLPGVGEKKAQDILDYRKEHGPFKDIEDLRNVKGIGEKRFEDMKAYLAVK